jgi:hypothetical protein
MTRSRDALLGHLAKSAEPRTENRKPRTENLYARIAIRANNNRSQPRHDIQRLASHRHPLRVQGVAPARRKVPETCRNGFWRKMPATRSGMNGTVSGEKCSPRTVA